MYLKVFGKGVKPLPACFSKTLVVMQITGIILLAACLQVSAAAFGQNVTITENNISLKEVFREIRKQTGYNFIYTNKIIREASPVSLNIKNAGIQEVLNKAFANQPLTFTIVDNVIVVNSKPDMTVLHNLPGKEINGSVRDSATGRPLVGVTIKVKGKDVGTVSDAQGQFSLNVPDNAILEISYLGYDKKVITVNGKGDFNIFLSPSATSLSQLVVVGYGTVSRKNLTDAVSTVESKNLDLSTSSNFAQSLQGQAAGVQVTQATGQPGANAEIQIRSNPSPIAPGVLYVVDGIPIQPGAYSSSLTGAIGGNKYGSGGADPSPLNFINPNDIESIEFLKGPSATAIYGAMAGSGVVLITTKRGKDGKIKIDYSGSYGIQKVDKMYPVYGAKDYMIQRNQLAEQVWYRNNQIAPYYGTVDANSVTPFAPIYSQAQIDAASNSVNAMNAITQKAFTNQQNLSLSGGNGKTTYFASGNYFDQQGVIIGTGFKRYNGFLSLDQNVSKKIRLGAKVLVSGSNANNTFTGGANEDGGIITAAVYWAPIIPLKNPDGSYPISPYYPNIPNPLSYGTVTNITQSNRTLTSAFGEWDIISGLTAKAQFSYDQSVARTSAYLPTTFLYGQQVNGEASINEFRANQNSMIYSLTYNHQIAPKHHINAVLAYDYEARNGDDLSAANQQFLSDAVSYYNLGSGQAVRPNVGSGKAAPIISESLVGRVIYTYNDLLTIQGSLRRDGFSTFAVGKKWGYFPAVSASWLLSDEPFIRSLSSISYLKLRGGYGEVGNPLTSASAFKLYGTALSPYFGTGSVNTGLNLTQAANPALTWETRAGFNAGIDFGFFNDRLSGSIDYFNTTNRNLINFVAYPVGFIINGVYINDGKTKSTGYEISLQSKNFVNDNNGFTWSTTVNFSHYLDYWVQRAPQDLATLPKYEAPTGKDALYNPVYGYISTGIFTGNYGKAPAQMPGMLPGGLIIKDIHGYDNNGNLTAPDGKITSADQTLLGNGDPQFSFGIGNRFTFRNFDLNIFMSGMVQHKWSPLDGNRALETQMNSYGWNAMVTPKAPWSVLNTSGTYPTELVDGTYAQYQNASSFWWVNASYLRCKDIILGYTLPDKWLSKQNVISSIRISFDAQNLFTITNYPGLDPELDPNNFYPLVKSYVFGINASF